MSTLTFQGTVGEVAGSRYLIDVDGNDRSHLLMLLKPLLGSWPGRLLVG